MVRGIEEQADIISLPIDPIVHYGRQWTETEIDEIRFFKRMFDGPAGIAGNLGIIAKPRTGKTAFEVYMMVKLHKYFGFPLLSTFHLKPAFPYPVQYFNEDSFDKDQQEMLNVIKNSQGELEGDARQIDDLWSRANIKLRRHVVAFDEIQKQLERRKSMNKRLVKYTHVMAEWGHYQSVFMFAAPMEEMIEGIRFKPLLTHEVGASFFKNYLGTGVPKSRYKILNRHTGHEQELYIDISIWSQLYHSYVMMAPMR